jgi:hypothetical protein
LKRSTSRRQEAGEETLLCWSIPRLGDAGQIVIAAGGEAVFAEWLETAVTSVVGVLIDSLREIPFISRTILGCRTITEASILSWEYIGQAYTHFFVEYYSYEAIGFLEPERRIDLECLNLLTEYIVEFKCSGTNARILQVHQLRDWREGDSQEIKKSNAATIKMIRYLIAKHRCQDNPICCHLTENGSMTIWDENTQHPVCDEWTLRFGVEFV